MLTAPVLLAKLHSRTGRDSAPLLDPLLLFTYPLQFPLNPATDCS
jgi:hypothetical protein